jgi:hypothetical protein
MMNTLYSVGSSLNISVVLAHTQTQTHAQSDNCNKTIRNLERQRSEVGQADRCRRTVRCGGSSPVAGGC